MFDLSKLSAAKLVLVHNATGAKAAKKFESAPRGLERTVVALRAMGVSAEDAARKAGLLPATGKDQAVNLVTGQVVSVANLHDPLRKVDGDPAKAAKRVARAVVAPMKLARLAAAGGATAAVVAATPATGDAPMLPASGPARSNACRPYIEARLAVPGGATLAELTRAAGWRAPYELAHLGKTAARLGKKVQHDGGAGAARRYWLAD